METKILKSRILHMHGVAELMYQYYDKFDCKDLSKDEIYFLGLNHDIGYLYDKNNHETKGSEILAEVSSGFSTNICNYIKYHGTTPADYMKLNNCRSNEIPKELILLWWADLMVESRGDKAGEVVGFEERLDTIKNIHGEDSIQYQICKDTVDWLIPIVNSYNINS